MDCREHVAAGIYRILILGKLYNLWMIISCSVIDMQNKKKTQKKFTTG